MPAALSEPPLLFAVGLFLTALGLLIVVLTPWLTARLRPLRLPAFRRSRTAARHKAPSSMPARVTEAA